MRNPPSLFAVLLALGLLAPTFAQRPANDPQRPAPPRQQPAQPEEDEEVVRITTNLVQVDAVVTDKDGRHVSELTPADFEITEDGRRQEITNFSYISVEPERAAARPVTTPAARAERDALPVPPARLKPGRARRTVVLVVDDLSMSAQTTVEIRRALRKYIGEQIGNDDLSAVIRTSSGSGVLQQFTADKRLLYAAVERLRWTPRGRGGLSAGGGGGALEVTGGDFEEQSVAGTLGALTALVRGMQSVPGRKAVVLFTDGLPLRPSASTYNLERYRQLVDLANRAAVSFYPVDSRGLQPLGPTAADPFGGMPHDTGARLMGMSQSFGDSQDGMRFLAKGTGGLFFRNQNNINKGLREVLDDQRGYYLIAYRPDDATFDARTGERKFRELKVAVKRAGLSVRSRSGFFGAPGKPERPRRPADAARRQLLDALSSPFGAADIDLRMAALFFTDPSRAPAIRSIIHLSAKDLQFAEADGRRKALVDLAVVVFTSDGRAAVQGRDQREVVLGEDEYRHALKNELTYRLNVPVKQPGAYNLRVAVRDAATGRTGSAREFVHVPDLAKGPLALSGVALSGVEPARDAVSAGAAEQLTGGAGVAAEAADPDLSPAVRRLRHGVFLDYGFIIYNARTDKATRLPRLTTQVRLFREGRLVFTGSVAPVDTTGQTDMKRIVAGGRLQVGTELEPGDYVLQVIADDTLAGHERADGKGIATQWVDFEIVK